MAHGEAHDDLLGSRPPNGGSSAWLRVVAYAALSFGTNGVNYVFSVLYSELLNQWGEPFPGALALVGSLTVAILTVSAPLAGFLSSRIGPRLTCGIGAALTAAGMAASATASRVWHLFLSWSVLVGLGEGLAFFTALLLMTSWFDTRLALVHTVGQSVTGIAALSLGPISRHLFDTIGWRAALLRAAVCDALLLGCAACVLSPPPHGAGARAAHRRTPAVGCRALCTPALLLLLLSMFVFGLTSYVVIVHIVRLGSDRGLSEREAAHLTISIGLGSTLLRVPIGIAADRFGRSATFGLVLLAYALLDLVAAVAPFAASGTFLSVFAFLAAGFTGGANSLLGTLPLDVLPPPAGTAAVPLIFLPFGVGLLLGPAMAGALRTLTGSYTVPLTFAAGCMVAAGCGVAGPFVCCGRHVAHRSSTRGGAIACAPANAVAGTQLAASSSSTKV